MTCTRCGLRNPKTAKVCGRCGEELAPGRGAAKVSVDSQPGKPRRAVQLTFPGDDKPEAKTAARRKSNPPRKAPAEPVWTEEAGSARRQAEAEGRSIGEARKPAVRRSSPKIAKAAPSKPPARKKNSRPPAPAESGADEMTTPPEAAAAGPGPSSLAARGLDEAAAHGALRAGTLGAEDIDLGGPHPAPSRIVSQGYDTPAAPTPAPIHDTDPERVAVRAEPEPQPEPPAAGLFSALMREKNEPPPAPPPSSPEIPALHDTDPERTQPPGPPTPAALAAQAEAEAEAPLQAHLAGVLRRTSAWAVDGFILFGLFILYFTVGLWAGDPRNPSSERGFDWIADSLIIYSDLVVPGLMLAAVAAFVYFSVFHALGGSTPGKRLLGLRVIGEDGTTLSFPDSALRTASSFLSMGLLFMGLVLVLFDRRGQALHDKLLHTYVVRDVL